MLAVIQPYIDFSLGKYRFGDVASQGGQGVYLLIEGVMSVQDAITALGVLVMNLALAPVNGCVVDDILA